MVCIWGRVGAEVPTKKKITCLTYVFIVPYTEYLAKILRACILHLFRQNVEKKNKSTSFADRLYALS